MTGMLRVKDIAKRIGRHPDMVATWRRRGQLPEPDGVRDGRRAWSTGVIDQWWETRQDEVGGPPRRSRRPDPFWEVEISDV